MSLFTDPDQHAANPPDTWQVVRHGRRWQLRTAGGGVLESFATKREALAARTDGFSAGLYARETRWYAGEDVPNWRAYADLVAEQTRQAMRGAADPRDDGAPNVAAFVKVIAEQTRHVMRNL